MAMIQNSKLRMCGLHIGSTLASTEISWNKDGEVFLTVRLKIHPQDKQLAYDLYLDAVNEPHRVDVSVSRIKTYSKTIFSK